MGCKEKGDWYATYVSNAYVLDSCILKCNAMQSLKEKTVAVRLL